MLKDRLVFTLLMDNGQYYLGRNFKLQKVGDLEWILDNYDIDSILHSVDELIVLNVGREQKNTDTFAKHLEQLAQYCFMPVAAGGGIYSISDAYKIISAGADKIVVNSALITDKNLVRDLVKIFGSQCIVASIDYKEENDVIKTFIKDSTIDSGLNIYEAIDNAVGLGIGEIFLNSIAKEGTGQGLDIDLVKKVASKIAVPIVASGGIERTDQFSEALKGADIKAVAASDLLYFMGDSLSVAREYMIANDCDVAYWGTLAEFENLQNKNG